MSAVENPSTLEPIVVRIPEACRLIGVGRSKLYELLSAGEIEAVKIGTTRLVLLASLRAFVEAHRRATA